MRVSFHLYPLLLLLLCRYSQEQVFHVISDVESYKVFLPWCHESKFTRKGQTNSIAKLSIGFPPLLETYTALVWTKPPHMLKVSYLNLCLFLSLSLSLFLPPSSLSLSFFSPLPYLSLFHNLFLQLTLNLFIYTLMTKSLL